MLRRSTRRLLAATAAGLLSAAFHGGCGTVLGHSEPQPINVHVNPDDPAEIRIDGIKQGDKGGTFLIDPKRESHHFFAKTADGRTGSGAAQRDVMPGVVIADAIMLIFPILIDYFDGGLYSWNPDVVINLGKPPEQTPPQTDPTTTSTDAKTDQQKPAVKKCPFCGEDRPVNLEKCPSCGFGWK
ncbi:MAG TPA: hypothetical protein VFF73_13745 [Planctomycetota bacterium]|nr:hypothetical protein [Planctomycetota bacterium]